MKPETADKARDREIKLIHIAKRDLQLDDETYRAMLWSIARVRSAKDLDFTGRKKVLDHLKARGFKVKAKASPSKNAPDSRWRKMRALWHELHKRQLVEHDTDEALRAFIKRLTGADDFRFLNNHQIHTVIESLKKWSTRDVPQENAHV
jgi:phage gp16-like protein